MVVLKQLFCFSSLSRLTQCWLCVAQHRVLPLSVVSKGQYLGWIFLFPPVIMEDT